jgi:chemotaxis protein methyltransferase CheR
MQSTSLPVLGEREFRVLQDLMVEVSGIRLAPAKRPLVAGRLLRRLRAHHLADYADYLALIKRPEHQQERRLVIDLLTTNETYFFREPAHFTFFGQWLAGQPRPLRIWSAACSSGEEAFTLAMVLAEQARHDDWRILASDLSQTVLARARQATYPLEDARDFPPGWLQRYCLKGTGEHDGKLRISQPLRDRVQLRELNLMRALPSNLEMQDVIFLRNVLIYFNAEDKRAIVARLIERLRPNGLLFIGHAESLHGMDLPLTSVSASVYRRA